MEEPDGGADARITKRTQLCILVVDDAVPNLQVVGTMLQNEGYEVMPAVSGKQALERCECERLISSSWT
jgi:CheY-like chemotaxis protein